MRPEQVVDMARAWADRSANISGRSGRPSSRPLHIAALATIPGLLMKPVGFLAARNATPVLWLNVVARFVLVATRSISTLIWALFFVAMFGPGPLAGALAIAFHPLASSARCFRRAWKGQPRQHRGPCQVAGATRMQQVLMGYWPG